MRSSASKAADSDHAREALADQRIHDWRDAAETVIRLQDAPYQEIRGRNTDAALARIEKFIATDPIYRSVRDLYAGQMRDEEKGGWMASRKEFRESVERALAILERLAHRNQDIEMPVELAEKSKYVYRHVAIQILLERTGRLDDSEGAPSIIGVRPLSRHYEILREVKSKDEAVAPPDAPKPPPEQSKEPLLIAAPGEERFFDLWCDYIGGTLSNIKGQHEFSQLLLQFQDGTSFPMVRNMITEADLNEGILSEQLHRVTRLAEECRMYGDGSMLSLSSAVSLYGRIDAVRENWGLSGLADPVQALWDDGFLTPDGAARLKASHEAMAHAHPIAIEILAIAEKKHLITPEHMTSLSEAVTRLSMAGKEDSFISSRVGQSLQGGPSKIDHILNCATLLSRKVHIDDLLAISVEGAQIIARAADGEFDRYPQSHARYGKAVRARIDAELRVLRRTDPKERAEFEKALGQIKLPGNIDSGALRTTLFTVFQTLAPINREAKIEAVGRDLATVAAGGGDLVRINKMFASPQPEVGVGGLIKFMGDLAVLQSLGPEGMVDFLSHAFEQAERRRAGEERRDVRGAMAEAATAVNLHKAGYKILALSRTLGTTGYDYDILALSPSPARERIAIEVKRSYEAFVHKNERMLNGGVHNGSQLIRFVNACDNDGFVPCIAVLETQGVGWAETAIPHLFGQLDAQFRTKLRLIDGKTCKEITYDS